jgi:hypothetical protein
MNVFQCIDCEGKATTTSIHFSVYIVLKSTRRLPKTAETRTSMYSVLRVVFALTTITDPELYLD